MTRVLGGDPRNVARPPRQKLGDAWDVFRGIVSEPQRRALARCGDFNQKEMLRKRAASARPGAQLPPGARVRT